MVDGKTFGATLWRYRNLLFIIIPPLACLPLPLLVEGKESQCGYVMIIMAIYWCTEALPLSVTAMIPVFLMPMMGLVKSDDVVVLYMQETTMMFSGGLMVALAIEKCNLHKRIALGILMLVGVKPIWLMVGFIAPTWFLSMWISNTATTSMMLPILEAVLDKLGDVNKEVTGDDNVEGVDNYAMDDLGEIQTEEKIRLEIETEVHGLDEEHAEAGSSSSSESNKEGNDPDNKSNGWANDAPKTFKNPVAVVTAGMKEPKGKSFKLSSTPSTERGDNNYDYGDVSPEELEKERERYKNLCKGMTLAVAYAANIGGTGTLTGTTPNIIMKDAADGLWEENLGTESPVNFASYMVFSTPTAFITIIFVWLWLCLFYMGPRAFNVCGSISDRVKGKEEKIKSSIREDFESLGKMHYDEWFVLVVFVSMVLLWFFRSPGFVDGWGDLMLPGYIKDSVTSMMCVVTLFVLPRYPFRWGSQKENGSVETLLDWDMIQHKFPWSVIFLVGGGMALAEAAETSGLSDMIGEALTVFDVLPLWFMTFLLALITSLLTEVTSNTATCTLIMPIVAKMAESIGINPLYLMMPCAVATSFAFMLPVATPPNAIAFSFNRVSVLDMVKAGAVLKLTVFVITLGTETWGMAYFGFKDLPWQPTNITNATFYELMKTNLHSQMTLVD